jgi:hypothetical protein
MDLVVGNGKMEIMDRARLSGISGGADIWGIIDKGCTIYGAYAFVVAITPGANLIGGGTIGAFCAGYKLGSWLFG